MKVFLIFVFFGFIPFGIWAQSYEWRGEVVSLKTGKPIKRANISNEKGKVLATTNELGEFRIKFSFSNKESRIFEISNVSFDTKFIELKKTDFKSASVLIRTIVLSTRIISFPAIDVTHIIIPPDTVYGLPEYNIGDFCFIGDKTLLLVYTKEKRWKKAEDQKKTYYEGCKLELLDSLNKKIDSYNLDGLFYGMYTQYLNEVFLTSPVKNYKINIYNDLISLDEIDLTSFKDFIEPVVDSIDNTVIATTFNPQIPAFEYFSFDKVDSIYQTIHQVEDEELLSVFRSEYKYLDGRGKLNAVRYEQDTGVDKEIIAAFMSGFVNSMFVKPLYAPAFTIEDTLLIFDHYQDKIFRYNSSSQLIDSVSIRYHKLQKKIRWKKEIIRDKENGSFHALFEKNGYSYLYEINTSSGEIENINKLFFKYAERLRIKNGEVYYIYRPFESSQKKFLYKEKLY